jgi:hypothetical protein
MKGSRRYLFLLLATACAHPAAAPPPITPPPAPVAAAPVAPLPAAPLPVEHAAAAPAPIAPPPVALPAPQPPNTPLALPPSATIFIGCGFLRVENHGSTTFSLVLPAAKPQQSKVNPSVVLLDGVLIQAGVTNAAEMGAPALRGQDLLRHQMSWEANRMAKRQGWNLQPPSGQPIELGLGGGMKTWFWGLDAPQPFEVDGVKVNRIAYFSVAVDDVVLTLASPLRPADDPDPIARVMSRAMRSIRRSPSPIDVFAVQETAMTGKLDPAFCARVGPS